MPSGPVTMCFLACRHCPLVSVAARNQAPLLSRSWSLSGHRQLRLTGAIVESLGGRP